MSNLVARAWLSLCEEVQLGNLTSEDPGHVDTVRVDNDGGGEKGGDPEIKTAPAARPGYTKPGYGGLIGRIQQHAAPDPFWKGREAERALYEQFNGAAPTATMTHNAQSPAAAEAYQQMYR
ncbi:hypothetical protein ACV1DY_03865 [Aeromonas caviae]